MRYHCQPVLTPEVLAALSFEISSEDILAGVDLTDCLLTRIAKVLANPATQPLVEVACPACGELLPTFTHTNTYGLYEQRVSPSCSCFRNPAESEAA